MRVFKYNLQSQLSISCTQQREKSKSFISSDFYDTNSLGQSVKSPALNKLYFLF